VIAVQVLAAIHVYKTGRPFYWLFAIWVFPVVGILAYFVVEILPTLRRSRRFSAPSFNLLDAIIPGRELGRLKENLELSDTVENRKALAEYYQRNGQWDEAIPLYEGCLRGPFKDDPAVHLMLAEAHFLAGHQEQARQLLEKVSQLDPKYEPTRRDFYLGRICEDEGRTAEARQYYEKIVTKFSGEEVRVRLALILEEAGETARAREIFADIVRRMRGAAAHYRHEQRHWRNLAHQGLKRLSQPQDSKR
jgi:hypothetical protein